MPAPPEAGASATETLPGGGATRVTGTRRRPPGRAALVVSTVVAGLAVVAGGVAGYFWWDTAGKLDRTRQEVSELNRTVADRDDEIDGLQVQLQGTEDDLAAVEQELSGAENMVDLLQDEQNVIRRCVTLNNEVVEAIINNDQAAFNAVIDEAEEVCAEADRILAG